MFNTERFILEIKTRPSIWQNGSTAYHNKNLRWRCWLDVGKIMISNFENLSKSQKQVAMNDLRQKWRHIRDSYRKYYKIKQGDKYTNGKTGKTYVYCDMLEFLNPVMQSTPRRTKNMSYADQEEPITNPLEESNIKIEIVEPCLRPGEHIIRQRTSKKPINSENIDDEETQKSDSYFTETSEDSALHMVETVLETQELEKQKIVHSEETEDGDKLFLLSLLPQIRQLTVDQKNYLYIEFLQTIQKARYLCFPTYAQNPSFNNENNLMPANTNTNSNYNMYGNSNVPQNRNQTSTNGTPVNIVQ